MLIPRYCSKEEFCKFVKESITISEVLRKLNLIKGRSQGHYFREFNKTIKELKLSIDHFDKYYYLRGSKRNLIPLKNILIANSTYNSQGLKKRLIETGLLDDACLICSQESIWNNKKLTLQLDHINGNHTDNRLENLRILCPNCHSQTETFSGRRNKNNSIKALKKVAKPKVYYQSRRIRTNWPPPEEVLRLVKLTSYRQVGKDLGISDKAVMKYLERFNLRLYKKRRP